MRKLRIHSNSTKRLFSTSVIHREALKLAYQRHDPPKGTSTAGPSIILLHGLFGSQRNNRTMSKVLAKDLSRPVYLLDLRNHGESPHSPTHDYTSMAEDVEHFIATHEIKQPTLIGHSMGAKVAMTMALRDPPSSSNNNNNNSQSLKSSYSALIPVDNAPLDAALKSDFGSYVQGLREIEDSISSIKRQSDADKILAKYESDTGIRQFLLTNLVKSAQGATKSPFHFRIPIPILAKSLSAMADFPFKDPDVTRFQGPTLFVRGTRSHYVADESLPVIGRFFPKFELLDVDCGHWVMSERFEDFRKGVTEWILRIVDGKG